MKAFEEEYPREAEVLMRLEGRLWMHVFSDGIICDHLPRRFLSVNPRKRCPVCNQPKP
jgi:hypothetical protein